MFSLLTKRPFLIIEFLLLCIALPSYIIISLSASSMFLFLWGAAIYCALIYRICLLNGETWQTIWKPEAVSKTTLKPILIRWLLAVIGLIVFCYLYDPERLFYLPIYNPELTLFLLLAYPFISALPQEFIFCSFFFKRYHSLFGNRSRMVWVSAIVFAYAHVLYINPVAPSLGLLGGLIFASTFRKHRSLALVSLEHALYGNALFIIGLGWYFYAGSMQVNS